MSLQSEDTRKINFLYPYRPVYKIIHCDAYPPANSTSRIGAWYTSKLEHCVQIDQPG